MNKMSQVITSCSDFYLSLSQVQRPAQPEAPGLTAAVSTPAISPQPSPPLSRDSQPNHQPPGNPQRQSLISVVAQLSRGLRMTSPQGKGEFYHHHICSIYHPYFRGWKLQPGTCQMLEIAEGRLLSVGLSAKSKPLSVPSRHFVQCYQANGQFWPVDKKLIPLDTSYNCRNICDVVAEEVTVLI